MAILRPSWIHLGAIERHNGAISGHLVLNPRGKARRRRRTYPYACAKAFFVRIFKFTHVQVHRAYLKVHARLHTQCTSVLVYRYTRLWVYLCTGILVYRCASVPVYQCIGIPVYLWTRALVYQTFWCTRVLVSRGIGVPVYRYTSVLVYKVEPWAITMSYNHEL